MKKKIYLLLFSLFLLFVFITHPVLAAESLDELSPCEDPNIVRVIYFGKIILDIIRTVVPIGMIIMAIIDFSKGVTSSDESSQKKKTQLLIKRLTMGIMIFAVPWMVGRLIVMLGNLTDGVNYTDCLENANEERLQVLQEEYDRLVNKEEAEQIVTNSNSNGVGLGGGASSGGHGGSFGHGGDTSNNGEGRYSDEVVSNLAALMGSEAGFYKDGFEAQLMTGAIFINNMYYPYYNGYTPIRSHDDISLDSMCTLFRYGSLYSIKKCGYRLNESTFPGLTESQKKQATVAAKLVLSGIFTIPKEINGQGNLNNWGSVATKWGACWTGKPGCTMNEYADTGCTQVYAYSNYYKISDKDVFGNTVSTNFDSYKSIADSLYQIYVVGENEIF